MLTLQNKHSVFVPNAAIFILERNLIGADFDRGSRVNGRGSKVNGRGSRVNGRGSRVNGRGSRVEKFFTIIFEHRQIKISCLLEFPVSVLFYINTRWYHHMFFLVSWSRLTFIILPGYTEIDKDRYK